MTPVVKRLPQIECWRGFPYPFESNSSPHLYSFVVFLFTFYALLFSYNRNAPRRLSIQSPRKRYATTLCVQNVHNRLKASALLSLCNSPTRPISFLLLCASDAMYRVQTLPGAFRYVHVVFFFAPLSERRP